MNRNTLIIAICVVLLMSLFGIVSDENFGTGRLPIEQQRYVISQEFQIVNPVDCNLVSAG